MKYISLDPYALRSYKRQDGTTVVCVDLERFLNENSVHSGQRLNSSFESDHEGCIKYYGSGTYNGVGQSGGFKNYHTSSIVFKDSKAEEMKRSRNANATDTTADEVQHIAEEIVNEDDKSGILSKDFEYREFLFKVGSPYVIEWTYDCFVVNILLMNDGTWYEIVSNGKPITPRVHNKHRSVSSIGLDTPL